MSAGPAAIGESQENHGNKADRGEIGATKRRGVHDPTHEDCVADQAHQPHKRKPGENRHGLYRAVEYFLAAFEFDDVVFRFQTFPLFNHSALSANLVTGQQYLD